MQVHAVPDSERAYDSTGRRLPWAFEYAEYVGSLLVSFELREKLLRDWETCALQLSFPNLLSLHKEAIAITCAATETLE